MKKTYKESLDYLFSRLPMFSRIGAAAYKPGLETSIRLAEFFDNPHNKFRSIHIGGTNGKGSTSHLLASVLQEKGLKTGLYTSPHLVDFRERIRINGEKIPKEKVIDFVDRWLECDYKGSPSFFELTMMMAFNWFAEENIDIAVIEVGMGGRLDSTNIITPELSIITNISKDHTQFLGETLEKIAQEKAGIIKKKTPVVIGESENRKIMDIFENKAIEMDSLLSKADIECEIKVFEHDSTGWNFNIDGNDYHVPLSGDYQKKNIQTVLKAIQELNRLGFDINDNIIREGFKKVKENTGLMGRWMEISTVPLVICDTGHNIAGLEYNFNQLRELIEKKKGKLHIVIGFVADKAIDEIMNLLPEEAEYYVTNASIPRALPSCELKKKFDERGLKNHEFLSVAEAYQEALKNAVEDDIVFVGGSTFIVADLLEFLEKQRN